jgi:hypothetical protein
MESTITKKSTGLKSNAKVSDLKYAVISSIRDWLYKVCENSKITREWNAIIEKQLAENICPLEAESWEYNSKWGYRLTIFTDRFTADFKEMIISSCKKDWIEIMDLESEQIIAGTEYSIEL